MLVGALSGASAEAPVEDYIRLHVVADDNSLEAQALKLEVRDAVRAKTRALLRDCADADAAWARLEAGLDEIGSAARQRARELGFDGGVEAVLGVSAFPERVYRGVTVPAGNYRALRVVLGEGAGGNWWCVLYPSLCLPEGETPETIHFYSVIWEWIKGLLEEKAS